MDLPTSSRSRLPPINEENKFRKLPQLRNNKLAPYEDKSDSELNSMKKSGASASWTMAKNAGKSKVLSELILSFKFFFF
jgi:hypothetical protein